MDEKRFDYKAYIDKKLKEIDDLGERRFAKSLLVEGFGELFSLFESKYEQLEERIRIDIEPDFCNYVLQNKVIHKSEYDPIHESLFHLSGWDVSSQDIKNPYKTIYLAADDSVCRDFRKQGRLTGTRKDNGEEVLFAVSPSERYSSILTRIYHLFLYNEIPWNTVHLGHIERFYDLMPIGWKADEEIGAINVDYGGFGSYVQEDMIPLWNIRKSKLTSGEFAIPCIDSRYYEHSFIAPDGDANQYLIGANADIEGIRYENRRIILKSKQDHLENPEFYQICPPVTEVGGAQEEYLTLSNHRKVSFAARYLHHMGRFLQTEGELHRKVEELTGKYGVELLDYQILSRPDKKTVTGSFLYADMNPFIQNEVFPVEKRTKLSLRFRKKTGDYLYQSHIRYLLSQLQLEFLEYQCVGELV